MQAIKLEVGKKYRRRDNKIEEITSYFKNGIGMGHYVYANDGNDKWFADGCYNSSRNESHKDLIEEIKDEVEMNEICIDKKYKTRDGRDVDVIAIRKQLHHAVIGIVGDSPEVDVWTITGNFHQDGTESIYDLIEVNPYADFKVDDKVLVSTKGTNYWIKRYFAELNCYGSPLVFINGKTSYTTNKTTYYHYCIRWEDRTEDMVVCDD
jgi:hypothetical protein